MDETPNKDAELLAKLIKLEPKPIEAIWSAQKQGDGLFGPSDETIYALLTYSAENYGKLAEGLTATGNAPAGGAPAWLSDELAARKLPPFGELAAKAGSAELFASPPYLSGYAIALEQSHSIVVCLFTS